jgi:hypothetical protein
MSMRRSLVAICTVLCMAAGTAPVVHAKDIPETWDHLVRVNSKKLKAVYLLPGANFSGYTKVMLDPPEAAFRKNWLRDYNRTTTRGLSRRLSDDDAQKMLQDVSSSAGAIFTKAFTDGGYQVVTQPGPDVLRIRIGIFDLSANAPDMSMRSAGRSRSYSSEAGTASLVLEARDSETGAVIGRAADGRVAGDMGGLMLPRSSVSNRADFEQVFKSWAKTAVNGLNTLKSSPPAAASAAG